MTKKTKKSIHAHFTYPVQDPYTMRIVRVTSLSGGVLTAICRATTRCTGTGRDARISKGVIDNSSLGSPTGRSCFLRFDAATGEQLDGARGWKLTLGDLAELLQSLLASEKSGIIESDMV